jgi:hypothetical protein
LGLSHSGTASVAVLGAYLSHALAGTCLHNRVTADRSTPAKYGLPPSQTVVIPGEDAELHREGDREHDQLLGDRRDDHAEPGEDVDDHLQQHGDDRGDHERISGGDHAEPKP